MITKRNVQWKELGKSKSKTNYVNPPYEQLLALDLEQPSLPEEDEELQWQTGEKPVV